VVIDPVLDYDPGSPRDLDGLDRRRSRRSSSRGLKLHYVFETHAHADHLSGSQVLLAATAPKVAIGAAHHRGAEDLSGHLRPRP
jgi:glyoxylase-like metal-dependent hydrolase (beta-lactamase superfamily II)